MLGLTLGDNDTLGDTEGLMDGLTLGERLGLSEGLSEGLREGLIDGDKLTDGLTEGDNDGLILGDNDTDGDTLGEIDGLKLGETDGRTPLYSPCTSISDNALLHIATSSITPSAKFPAFAPSRPIEKAPVEADIVPEHAASISTPLTNIDILLFVKS